MGQHTCVYIIFHAHTHTHPLTHTHNTHTLTLAHTHTHTALPFTKNPEQHPTFKVYFSKEWADTFVVTLHNFFSTLFSCLHILTPLPPINTLICILYTVVHTLLWCVLLPMLYMHTVIHTYAISMKSYIIVYIP